MTHGQIIWETTIRNAILTNQFDWVKKWLNDPKDGYNAKQGLKEYEEFLNGKRGKWLCWIPDEYEHLMFNKYKDEAMRDL